MNSQRFLTASLILTGLAFSTIPSLSFYTPKMLILRTLLVVGYFLLCFQWLESKRITFPASKNLWLILGFSCILLAGELSNNPLWSSQEKLLDYVTWFSFIVLTWLVIKKESCVKDLFKLSILLSLLLTAYGFIQHFGFDPIKWYPGGKRIFSFIGDSDLFATFMAMLLSIQTVRFIKKPTLWLLLLIAAQFLAIYWSYTRGALFAFSLTTFLILLLLLLSRAPRVYAYRLIGIFFLLAATFLVLQLTPSLFREKQRFRPQTWKADQNVIARKYLFKKGVETLAMHPWIGIGPGNFPFSYLLFRNDEPQFYRTRLAIGEDSHNTFLDAGIETGLVGGLCFLGIWLYPLFVLIKKSCSKNDSDLFNALTYLFPLGTAFFALQFNSPDVATQALTAYLLGSSMVLEQDESKSFHLSPLLRSSLVSAILLLGSLFVFHSMRVAIADCYVGKGNRAIAQNDLNNALKSYIKASFYAPWDYRNYQKVGKAYEQVGQSNQAFINYDRALKLNSKDPYLWADVGRLAATSHNRKLALYAYVTATNLDPYNPILQHDAALAAFNLGIFRMAMVWEKTAWELDPENPNYVSLYALILLRQHLNVP